MRSGPNIPVSFITDAPFGIRINVATGIANTANTTRPESNPYAVACINDKMLNFNTLYNKTPVVMPIITATPM